MSEAIRNYAIVAGGVLGLILALWRVIVANRQSRASQSQADTARRAHTTEVFNEAVGQLGHDNLEIRLGAIYTLKQISEDFPEFDHYVFQILTAYVKERTAGVDAEIDPSIDIQEIMGLLRTRLTEPNQ